MRIGQLRTQKGLAAIEFIIVMPLLFILMAGVIELGVMLVKYQTLTKLVQRGAYYAVNEVYNVHFDDESYNFQDIKCIVVTGSDDCSNTDDVPLANLSVSDIKVIRILNSGTEADEGDAIASSTIEYIKVTASYQYSLLDKYGVVNLNASAVARVMR